MRGVYTCAGSDIAVLRVKKSKAYLVLSGEGMKRCLNGGVYGFCLPLQDPVQETTAIIALWSAFSTAIQARHDPNGRDFRPKVIQEFRAAMRPMGSDLRRVIPRYLDRTFGKGRIVPLTVADQVKDLRYAVRGEAQENMQRLQNLLTNLRNRKQSTPT